ncbi:MAG: nucleoside deaminase [Methylococcales bacterium]|nr:nucleoside deaminase [Methylococcales bacterium]
MNHEYFMRRAIELALEVPQFPFGAVIVKRATGEIVAEGFNQSVLNPTFHGEMVAINRCAELRQPTDWTVFDLYTTAEPCPMCQSAIQWTGIACVYFGTSIPYLKEHHWQQINIRASEVIAQTPFRKTTIVGGILEAECNALFDNAPRGVFHQHI